MILAVASGGGHFVQLKKVMASFDVSEVTYFSTIPNPLLPGSASYLKIPDSNMSSKISLIICFIVLFYRMILLRPKVVISTGAAPGFLALLVGKCIGAKTIWIDSIANSETLSLAGKKAKWVADYWYTQWPELATADGPDYIGAVL